MAINAFKCGVKITLFFAKNILLCLLIGTCCSYHIIDVETTCKSYSLVGTRLCTNLKKLTVAEVMGPVSS